MHTSDRVIVKRCKRRKRLREPKSISPRSHKSLKDFKKPLPQAFLQRETAHQLDTALYQNCCAVMTEECKNNKTGKSLPLRPTLSEYAVKQGLSYRFIKNYLLPAFFD